MEGATASSAAPDTLFFGPGTSESRLRARLVLLRGDGADGASHTLDSDDEVCGRSQGGLRFPDDPTVSPAHAKFFFRDGRLFVRDLGTTNGTYIRVRERVPLQDGDFFVCGEQVFRYRPLPGHFDDAWEGNTAFCGTPALVPWRYQIRQVLTGGRAGEIRSVHSGTLSIGREDCDLNFPQDRFISHYHSRLVLTHDACYLEDTESTNGTFHRIRGDANLQDGDYLFVGRQLIFVEIA